MKFWSTLMIGLLIAAQSTRGADKESKLTRIAERDDKIPKTVTRIDFGKDPAGKELSPGTDISNTFVPVGCKFESSFKDSFVAIEPYNVGGRSGGRCAGTHKPLYQGAIIIRFCKPGAGDSRATVQMVGFWTSHVAPDGTALEAYDKDVKLIGSIRTVINQLDFLAVTSKVPIAYIKIVPNNDIDPDYAIDDLFFDTPKVIE